MPGKRTKTNVTSYKKVKCAFCNENRMPTSRYCMRCWVSIPVKKKWRMPNNEETELLISKLIEKLYLSDFSCFYTGIKLIPGLNASIDHRIPKNKGGENTIENLEWVHVGINNMKADRTEKQFIAAYGSMLVEYNLLASKGII